MLNPDKFSKIFTFYFIKVVLTVGKSLSILYLEHKIRETYNERRGFSGENEWTGGMRGKKDESKGMLKVEKQSRLNL